MKKLIHGVINIVSDVGAKMGNYQSGFETAGVVYSQTTQSSIQLHLNLFLLAQLLYDCSILTRY